MQDRRALPGPLIGLVDAPKLFACEDCGATQDPASRIEIRAMPNGTARVEASISAAQLFAAEYAYEWAGALVFERHDGWFRVAYETGTGWLDPRDAGRFRPLETLFRDWGYATPDWNGLVFSTPGIAGGAKQLASTPEPQVDILGRAVVDGALWLRVRIVEGSPCDAGTPVSELPELERGWVPALAHSGRPNVWFHSRGC